jgi:ribosomal protein L14E/L6E/L27E
MAAIEPGKKVLITRGSDAGKIAEIVKVLDRIYIQIKLPSGKERKINIRHVEPA